MPLLQDQSQRPKRFSGWGPVDPNQQQVAQGDMRAFGGTGTQEQQDRLGNQQRQQEDRWAAEAGAGARPGPGWSWVPGRNENEAGRWVQGNSGPAANGTVAKAKPGGTANYYDDSWLQLLTSLKGGEDPGAAFTRLLEGFKGEPSDLESFFDNPAARMAFAYMLGSGKGAKFMGDFSQEPSMRAFASGKGQIGQAAEMANQGQQAQLASMGLGRSGLAGAASAGIMQQAGGQSAQLGAALEQQRYSNLLQQAQMSFDTERIMAQLALGQTPAPSGGGGGMDSTAALIGAAGTVLGSLVGAPWLGAAAGAGYGAVKGSGGGGGGGGSREGWGQS